MIKVHVWQCGSTRVDEALPLANRSTNPLAFTGIGRSSRHRIVVPVRAYLIEHPRARILVDTGWDTAIRENAFAYEGLLNYFASPGELPPQEAVSEHLAAMGYSSDTLDYCILTHLDIDHAGGLRLVQKAKRILVNQNEWHSAQGWNPRYRQKLWQGIPIETFPAAGIDLLGDGMVQLLPLAGHSVGMTGIRVGTPEEYLVIAGDAGYLRDSWQEEALPGIVWDKAAARRSLHQLHQYGLDEKCKGILMTHDPEELPSYYELGGE